MRPEPRAVAEPDPAARASTAAELPPPPAVPPVDPRFAALPALSIRVLNTGETLTVRLYADDGSIAPSTLTAMAQLFRDPGTGDPSPVVARTLQLLAKIAAHFGATAIDVVSAYRAGPRADGSREGYHGVGSAVDFALPGTDARSVAAYARSLAHVGVGYYPRGGFVHLDSRAQSYFWEDRSGHHRHRRRSRGLARDGAPERDARWSAADDLPWDPAGSVTAALVLDPGPAPRAREAHRHRRRRHARHRPALNVFRGVD